MNLSKAFLVIISLGMAGGPAQSRPLQIVGTAGYLSEWVLKGSVAERVSAGKNEFFGPLVWEHVGLCSVSGPVFKQGEIRFQISTSGSLSHINAEISFDGDRCKFRGNFSDGASGTLDCPMAGGIPFSLSFK